MLTLIKRTILLVFSKLVMSGQLSGTVLLVIPLSQNEQARLFSQTFDGLYLQ